jgi:hypothetical protein
LPGASDDSDHPSTLPQPELNPLLNPVLGRHMGRWAEVYFTSVPEKREEAVLQLLRELEEQDSSLESSSSPVQRPESVPANISHSATANQEIPGRQTSGNPVPSNRASSNEAPGESCFWCGHMNRRDYKFCSRCGEPLTASFAPNSRTGLRTDFKNAGENGSQQTERRERQSYTDFLKDNLSSDDRSADHRSQYDGAQHDHPEDGRLQEDPGPRILPSFQPPQKEPSGLGELSHGWERDDLQVPEWSKPSLRPWFVAVLVTVVIATAYVAWRGTPSRPQVSSSAVQPNPPRSFGEPATNTLTRYPDTPAPAAPTSSAKGGRTIPASPSPAPATNTPISNVAVSPAQHGSLAVPPEKITSDKGAQELAQAQDFLEGKNGKQHSSEQAAEWLWRAVQKENAEATVLLSGLYLRGDGVAKNCDQARLLLDAAAGKGRKDAAEQLQHMAAFGCQ